MLYEPASVLLITYFPSSFLVSSLSPILTVTGIVLSLVITSNSNSSPANITVSLSTVIFNIGTDLSTKNVLL